jgi:O-antigen/teichoic acid export membrane protein
LRAQLKSFAIYGLGTLSTSVLGFVLLPLYLNQFPPEQFGVVNILLLATTFASMFLNAGIMSALHKQYFVVTGPERKELVGQVVLWYIAVGLLVSLVGWAFARPISSNLFRTDLYGSQVRLLGPMVLLTLTVDVPFNVLRLENRPRDFVLLSIIRILVETVMKYLFLIVLRRGIRGYFESSLLSLTLTNVVVYVFSLGQIRFSTRMGNLRTLLRLGVPFVFSGFAIWSLDAVVRLILNYSQGAGAVGLFSTGQRFAQIFTLVLFQPVSLMMPPFVFSYVAAHTEGENKVFFGRIFAILVLAGTAVVVVIGVGSTDLMRVLVRYLGTRQEYANAQSNIVPLTLANLFYFLTMPAGYVALWIHKTRVLAIASTVTAALNVLASYLLIRLFGPNGAGLGMALSYLLYLIIAYAALNRHQKVAYPFRLGLFETALAIACIYGISILPVLPPVLSLFAKTSLSVVLFGVGTWWVGLRMAPDVRRRLAEETVVVLTRLGLSAGHSRSARGKE